MAGSRAKVTVHVRVKEKAWRYDVVPDADAVDVELDLAGADSLEIELVDASAQAITFPSGIEWRTALIVEGGGS